MLDLGWLGSEPYSFAKFLLNYFYYLMYIQETNLLLLVSKVLVEKNYNFCAMVKLIASEVKCVEAPSACIYRYLQPHI